jgi:NADH:ubiquinone oxidoreductase subunit 3 (subunit A)
VWLRSPQRRAAGFLYSIFLIAVIFVIFDVEIALLLPLLVSKRVGIGPTWLVLRLVFIRVLVAGVVVE